MITQDEIVEIGQFVKPHGINGEITATFPDGFSDEEICEFSCIITCEDGIFVPFFISSARPKSSQSLLLSIDGVSSEMEARHFAGKTIYVKRDEIAMDEDYDGEDGAYASDYIGYTITDDEQGLIGEIADIDDSTENCLFIVRRTDGTEVLIPIAQEYITAIDTDTKTISMSLPIGLI